MAARLRPLMAMFAGVALPFQGAAAALLPLSARDSASSKAYTELMTHVREVNNTLQMEPRAQNVATLLQMMADAGKMAHQTAGTADHIMATTQRNRALRQAGNEARKHIRELTSELQIVQSQFEDGRKYVAGALKMALQHDAGSEFIRQLNSREAEKRRAVDMQRKFSEIEMMGRASRRGLSLLQLDRDMNFQLATVVQEAFLGLNRNLGQLTQAVKEHKLDAAVAHMTEEVGRTHNRLRQEQASLDHAASNVDMLHDKLNAAVGSLTKKERRLKASLGALQLMARRFIANGAGRNVAKWQPLASQPQEGFSLLQHESAKQHATRIDAIDVGSGGAFHSVASRVEELQAQLTSTEISNKRNQARKKTEYEERLNTDRRANLEVASANARTWQEIQDLQAKAKGLKKQAMGLQADLQLMQDDWDSLETNFSTALEVTSKVLAGVKELNQAPELRVLEELNERDRGLGETEQARHRFDEILGASEVATKAATLAEKAALLQVTIPGSRSSLLAALESGLQELSAENERELHGLDIRYGALLKEAAASHVALLAEQKSLEQTRSGLQKVTVRLQRAIGHLRDLNHNASQEAASVRAYFAQIGGRALPVKSAEGSQPQHVSAPSTTIATTQKSEDDPDRALFELDSLLAEPPSSSRQPPMSSFEVASEVGAPTTAHIVQPQAVGGKKEWLSWLTR